MNSLLSRGEIRFMTADDVLSTPLMKGATWHDEMILEYVAPLKFKKLEAGFEQAQCGWATRYKKVKGLRVPFRMRLGDIEARHQTSIGRHKWFHRARPLIQTREIFVQ